MTKTRFNDAIGPMERRENAKRLRPGMDNGAKSIKPESNKLDNGHAQFKDQISSGYEM